MARHLRLGRKLDRLRYRRLGTPRPILCPTLRQIKPTIDQRLAVAARVSQEHADLAVLDPPRRSGVLTRDTGGMIALSQIRCRRRSGRHPHRPTPPRHNREPRPAAGPRPSGCARTAVASDKAAPLRIALPSASRSCAQCRKEGPLGNLCPSPAAHDEEAPAQPAPSAPRAPVSQQQRP